MPPQVKNRAIPALLITLFVFCFPSAWAQKPLAIYVLNFDTNISGQNRTVAVSLTTAVETAFSNRRAEFKVLERRSLAEIVRQNKLEGDLNALSKGERPSTVFMNKLSQADGVLRGELREELSGVVLTLSLTKLDSEKLWQSQKSHTLYEWLNSDLQARDAEELAAAATAAVRGPVKPTHSEEDVVRGIALAEQGHCKEAIPFLQNAAAADSKNTEVFYQMGRCQNQTGEYEAAMGSLGSAIETNTRRADLFIERATSFMALKDFLAALHDLDQALKINPGNLAAVELRGDVFMQRGNYSDAVSAYYEVYRQQPTRARCNKLSNAYHKNGVPNAAQALEQSCGSLP